MYIFINFFIFLGGNFNQLCSSILSNHTLPMDFLPDSSNFFHKNFDDSSFHSFNSIVFFKF